MTELWRELGGYQAMVDAGVDMVVAEARILYRSPLRFDDDFEAQVEIERLGETSMSAEILLARDGEPVAEGELRYVFVESGRRRYSADPGADPRRVSLATRRPTGPSLVQALVRGARRPGHCHQASSGRAALSIPAGHSFSTRRPGVAQASAGASGRRSSAEASSSSGISRSSSSPAK